MTRRLHIALPLCAALLTVSATAAGQPDPLTPRIDLFPPAGEAPLTVLISGARTTGKWGSINDIDAWEWDFDFDGGTFVPERSYLDNATVAYTFDRPGTHTVRLRVTDSPNQGGPREAFLDATVEVRPATSDPATPTPYPPGAWGAGINSVWASDEELAAAAGYVRPVIQAFMQWTDVEPTTHGSYDWSRLDAALTEAAATDQRVAVQVNSELPDWVFEHIAQTGTARGKRSPQFWDPDYIAYYEALITELGAHIAAAPNGGRVLYVRHQWNAVHTETTHYDGTTDGDAAGTWLGNGAWVWPSDGHRYEVEWSEAIALDYERRIIAKFLDTFRPLDVGVTLRVISSHLPPDEQDGFYDAGDTAAWLLLTNANYMKWDGGHQLTREFSTMRCFGALGFEETKNDSASRLAEINPELSAEQDIYGVVLRALEVGLPYVGIYGSDLALAADNPEFQAAFAFANRYAGWHRYPRSAPGAWLVLGRFEGSTDWRKLQTLARDNWGMFLRQNDPIASTTAMALVGDPSSRFGLTARQLTTTTTFDLDDGFAAAVDGVQVDLQVTTLASAATIAVQVDQGGTLVALTESGHEEQKGWRTTTYPIADPAFSGGPDGQTDIALSASSGEAIIHSLELLRSDAPVVGDGGTPPIDGGLPPGATPSEGPGNDGGCAGCSVPGRSPATGLLATALGSCLIGWRRRRRRAC